MNYSYSGAMKLIEDRMGLLARLAVTFAKYFVVVGYVLFVLRRFGTLLTVLPLAEGVLILLVGGVGCFFIVKRLDAWLASFDTGRTRAHGKAT
jgi:hypothetical protein